MRVYIADDDAEVRRALRLLLEQEGGYEVVGEAAHTHGLVGLAESAAADLVIIDWELPGQVGRRLLAAIHELSQAPRIIAVSTLSDLRERTLGAGADAFAAKCNPPDQLLDIVRALRSA